MPIPHVLYVDNDFQTKKRATILLFSNGIDVVPVSNLAEAIGMLRVIGRVDLIICDMHLSDGEADHLIQTVKASPDLSRTPILVVSAKMNAEEKQAVMRVGAGGYILKMEEAGVYVKTVKEMINTHRESFRETSKGISGQLAKLRIVDLIGQLAKDHGSGCISIDGKIPMEIYLRDGQITHARHGITVGKKALARCLRIAEAAFHFQAADKPVEESIQGDLVSLLEEARNANEKLMANYHKLPNPKHRVRLIKSDSLEKTTLKPEARAALEICKKYPRIGTYLDRLNLPDMVCFEYILTFLERGYLELVEDHKPVRIITDNACDLSKEELEELNVVVMEQVLRIGPESFRQEDGPTLYKKKIKNLEQAKVQLPEKESLLAPYRRLLPEYDCLSLFNGFTGIFEEVQKAQYLFHEHGLNNRTLLANELTTINSHSLSLGQGLVVRYAAEMAAANMQIESIEEHLIQCLARLHVIFAIQPDRSYLLKKGAPVIIYWDTDRFQPIARLGKGEDVINELVHEVHKRMEHKSKLHLAVGHISAKERAAELCEKLTSQLGLRTAPINPIGAVCGYQLGEGTLGVAFFQE